MRLLLFALAGCVGTPATVPTPQQPAGACLGCVDLAHVHQVGTPDLQTDPDRLSACLVFEFMPDGGGELVVEPCTVSPGR